MVACLLSVNSSALEPFLGTNVTFITTNHMREIFDGYQERAFATLIEWGELNTSTWVRTNILWVPDAGKTYVDGAGITNTFVKQEAEISTNVIVTNYSGTAEFGDFRTPPLFFEQFAWTNHGRSIAGVTTNVFSNAAVVSTNFFTNFNHALSYTIITNKIDFRAWRGLIGSPRKGGAYDTDGLHTNFPKQFQYALDTPPREVSPLTAADIQGLAGSLTRIITNYVRLTNISQDVTGTTNAFFENWTVTGMVDHLNQVFTNTDGSTGVGVFTNGTWFFTQDIKTDSITNIILGHATFEVVSTFTSNGIVHRNAAWVYRDGTEAMLRTASPSSIKRSKELGNFNQQFLSTDVFPNMVDLLPNMGPPFLEIQLGSTNWTFIETNLTVTVNGATNYPGGTATVISESTTVNGGNGDTQSLTNVVFDLVDSSLDFGVAVKGLAITNTAVITNSQVVTHLGDTIICKLRRWEKSFWNPEYPTLDFTLVPGFEEAFPHFSQRETLNEFAAILGLLRFTQQAGTFTANGVTNKNQPDFSSSLISMADAQTKATNLFATNTASISVNDGFPYVYSVQVDNTHIPGGQFSARGAKRSSFLLSGDLGDREDATVLFYAKATDAASESTASSNTFDSQGEGVLTNNAWASFDATQHLTGAHGPLISRKFGGDLRDPPVFGPSPLPGGTNSSFGFEVIDKGILIKWQFQHFTNSFP